jgi:tetratricopeptide (TPR) repeat protein
MDQIDQEAGDARNLTAGRAESKIARQQISVAQIFLFALLILVVTAICYWNSLDGQFVYDDKIVVVQNQTIKSLKSVPLLFTQSYWGDNYAEQGNYRPLTNVSFAFNYAISGLNPRYYHLCNLLLHAFNSFLIGWLIWRYCESQSLALFAALLYVAHPIHTEPVANIAGRSELLAATFFLLAWLSYSYRNKDRRYYWLSLLAYFCGLLSKESVIVLAGVLALADLSTSWPDWRAGIVARLRDYSGYIVATILYLVIRIAVLNQVGINSQWTFFQNRSFITRALTMSQALIKYFQLLIWPAQLSSDYDFSAIPLASALTARVAISLVIIAIIVTIGILSLWRNRLIAFAVIYFFITISIVSNIVFPTGILMADRSLYLPSLTICLLIGGALAWLWQSGKWQRWAAVGACGLLLTASAGRDYYRNLDWRDDEACARALLRSAPNNPKSYIAMGMFYRRNNRFNEAEAALKAAIALSPDKATQHGALGELYLQQGRYDEALIELNRSLELYSRHGFVHIALARLYNHQGKYREAVESYRRGIELSPPDPLLREELAVALYQAGDLAGAYVEFDRVLEMKPDFAEAHANLALLLRAQGRADEALPHLQAAVELDKNNAGAHNAFGLALLEGGQLPQAGNEFAAAIAINNNFAEAHNNLGVVYIQLQRVDEARREFETALRIKPDYLSAARNLDRLKSDGR